MKMVRIAALAAAIGLGACTTTGGGGGPDIQPTVYSIGQKYAWLLNGVDALGFPIPAQFCGPIKAVGTLYFAAQKISVTGTGDTAAIIQDLETSIQAALTAAFQVGFSLAAHPPLMATPSADPTPAQWAAQEAAVNAGLAGLRC